MGVGNWSKKRDDSHDIGDDSAEEIEMGESGAQPAQADEEDAFLPDQDWPRTSRLLPELSCEELREDKIDELARFLLLHRLRPPDSRAKKQCCGIACYDACASKFYIILLNVAFATGLLGLVLILYTYHDVKVYDQEFYIGIPKAGRSIWSSIINPENVMDYMLSSGDKLKLFNGFMAYPNDPKAGLPETAIEEIAKFANLTSPISRVITVVDWCEYKAWEEHNSTRGGLCNIPIDDFSMRDQLEDFYFTGLAVVAGGAIVIAQMLRILHDMDFLDNNDFKQWPHIEDEDEEWPDIVSKKLELWRVLICFCQEPFKASIIKNQEVIYGQFSKNDDCGCDRSICGSDICRFYACLLNIYGSVILFDSKHDVFTLSFCRKLLRELWMRPDEGKGATDHTCCELTTERMIPSKISVKCLCAKVLALLLGFLMLVYILLRFLIQILVSMFLLLLYIGWSMVDSAVFSILYGFVLMLAPCYNCVERRCYGEKLDESERRCMKVKGWWYFRSGKKLMAVWAYTMDIVFTLCVCFMVYNMWPVIILGIPKDSNLEIDGCILSCWYRIADWKLRVGLFGLILAQFIGVHLGFLRAAHAAVSGRTFLMSQPYVPLKMAVVSNPDNPFFGLAFASVGLNGPDHKPNALKADIILLLYKGLWFSIVWVSLCFVSSWFRMPYVSQDTWGARFGLCMSALVLILISIRASQWWLHRKLITVYDNQKFVWKQYRHLKNELRKKQSDPKKFLDHVGHWINFEQKAPIINLSPNSPKNLGWWRGLSESEQAFRLDVCKRKTEKHGGYNDNWKQDVEKTLDLESNQSILLCHILTQNESFDVQSPANSPPANAALLHIQCDQVKFQLENDTPPVLDASERNSLMYTAGNRVLLQQENDAHSPSSMPDLRSSSISSTKPDTYFIGSMVSVNKPYSAPILGKVVKNLGGGLLRVLMDDDGTEHNVSVEDLIAHSTNGGASRPQRHPDVSPDGTPPEFSENAISPGPSPGGDTSPKTSAYENASQKRDPLKKWLVQV